VEIAVNMKKPKEFTVSELGKSKAVQEVLRRAFPGSSKRAREIALREADMAVEAACSMIDEFDAALLTPSAHTVMLCLYLAGIARGCGSWPRPSGEHP
jgi:hypothetical protein